MSNFMSPDPGIIERPYVQQVPLDALFKNLAYKTSQYDQGYQEAKQKLDTLNDIASYGHDTEVKNQLFNQLNGELDKFTGANFGNKDINSHLDELVNNFTTNNDIAGIHSRAIAYDKMQKDQAAALAKGKDYYNPGLNQLNKYYQDGIYKKGFRANDTGNIAPDMSGIMEQIGKLPGVKHDEVHIGADGRQYTTSVVDGDRAMQMYNFMQENDPKLKNYTYQKFLEAHPDAQDDPQYFSKVGSSMATTTLNQAKDNLNLYSQQLEHGNLTDKQKVEIGNKVSKGREAVNYYQDILDNTHSPEEYKNWLYMQSKNKESERFGKMMDLHVTSKIGADEIAMENLKLRNDLTKQTHQAKLDAGLNPDDPNNPYLDESNRPTGGGGSRTINGTSFVGGQLESIVEGAFEKKAPDQTLTDILIKSQPEPLMYNNPKVTVDDKGVYHIQSMNSDGSPNENVPELKYSKADIYSKLGGADQRAIDRYHQSTQVRVGNQFYPKTVDPSDGLSAPVMPSKEALTKLPPGKYAVKNGNKYDFYTVKK